MKKAERLDQTEAFQPSLDDGDPRLVEISRAYLAELEAGRIPDRTAYLNRYPDLRSEAIEYLDGIDLAFTLQGATRPAAVRDPAIDPQPLGDFRILREIGRGGMGIVYEAMQLSLGRHVALKVLPFAASLDERHLQRFRLEAQAAAQLHHNHIVPVYAVGCERGTHFYAMQLINGLPISAAIFDSTPSKQKSETPNASTVNAKHDVTLEHSQTLQSLSRYRDRYRAIATLMSHVADALDYAHSCGIIHRDVKPGNLLLDAQGKIWVTDFGLAHVAANNSMTQTGDLVGTLRYMSPEQASGQRGVVDHRADVYSLGATMYELLTRHPIFEAQDRQSLLHQILNADPKPPRQLDAAIPLELETIVLKATQHSPADRYSSAEALAADLRRFLDERPILAKRPTLVDQSRKWMRRHPSAVVSILCTLVVCVLALGATTAAVTRQKMLTQDSLNREQQRAIQAEQRLDLAQRAADEMFSLAEEELSNNPHEEVLRQRLLNSALKYYQAFIEERKGDAAAQAELQVTRDRIAKILADLALVQADRDTLLLREPSVQEELKMSDQQASQIMSFIDQYEADRRKWAQARHDAQASESMPQKKAQSMYEHVLEQAKQNDTMLSQILTSEQRKRLRQIAIQMQGPMALRDLSIAGELELTKTQKEAIQSQVASHFLSRRQTGFGKFGSPEFGKAFGGKRPMDRGPRGGKPDFDGFGSGPSLPFAPPDRFERLDDLTTSVEEQTLLAQLLELLTPSQRQQWNELVGPPFQYTPRDNKPTDLPGLE